MVSIVMAVYNGEKYLREQLDSIRKQTDRQWKLFIRDDGSTDRTVSIISQFKRSVPQEVVILHNNGGKRGAKHNFLALIDYVSDDYVMFCDQDDVWKPDKIKHTLRFMKKAERLQQDGWPVLVHSNLAVADAEGRVVSDSFFNSAGLPKQSKTGNLLIQNNVTGCTVMINRALLSLAKNLPNACRENCIMHDYWLALCAQIFGKIYFLDESTVSYRQHGENSVGAKDSKSIAYLMGRLRDGRKDYKRQMEASRKQARCFYHYYKPLLEGREEAALLKSYGNLGRRGKFVRCCFYIRHHVWKQGAVRKMMQLIWG